MQARNTSHHRGDNQRHNDHLEKAHEDLAYKFAEAHEPSDEPSLRLSCNGAENQGHESRQRQRTQDLPVRLDLFHRDQRSAVSNPRSTANTPSSGRASRKNRYLDPLDSRSRCLPTVDCPLLPILQEVDVRSGPHPFRPLPHRISPRGRSPNCALQLALCP